LILSTSSNESSSLVRIEELVSVIAKAPTDLSRRAKWLEPLWDAYLADAVPYIETLSEFWGKLCVTKELAWIWADNLD